MPEYSRREAIKTAIGKFKTDSLSDAAVGLLNALGYESDRVADDFGKDAETFLNRICKLSDMPPIKSENVKADRWKSCAFLFQLTDDEISSLVSDHTPESWDRGRIRSFVFLAVDLQGDKWSRTDLAAITREINRPFPMPAIIIFRHESLLSMAVIDRRANLRDSNKDVVSRRITLIKDVCIDNPHRAHVDILADLNLENLSKQADNFDELYEAWIGVLSTQKLNKRFYTELSQWYFWAVKQVEFPKGGGEYTDRRNYVAIIRMLTRLIFVWFVKEMRLIPEELFNKKDLPKLLKYAPIEHPDGNDFYLAILQNLFFATLNVEGDRKWAQDGKSMKSDRLIHSRYRYKELFKKPAEVLKLFSDIPFLNGGLFECLDRELVAKDLERDPNLKKLASKEGNGLVLRVDGFSRRQDAQPKVPNKLFFGKHNVDISAELGASNRSRSVFGLIDLLNRYKFTVDENTPLEEEVALDPELLGKVFENLLASYNEETRDTARKQSGSFYTPREVVDYMVDEALIAYFKRHLPQTDDSHLRYLLSHENTDNRFDKDDTAKLIAATESLKILDPACGSGAFPMGILSKLVHVLNKLDPNNTLWRKQNLDPLKKEREIAQNIDRQEAEEALEKAQSDFENVAHADYTRKLYLIEKCIYGVDIQPIAVQIAKLRFFISLIVSQEVDKSKIRANYGIAALPNLETKIVAADTLIPIEHASKDFWAQEKSSVADVDTPTPIEQSSSGFLLVEGPRINRNRRELKDANKRHFTARTSKTKRKWREKIIDLRDDLATALEKDRFLPEGVGRQLARWNPLDQNTKADFFDPEWMFQLTGFDIIIGNPPYVRLQGKLSDLYKGVGYKTKGDIYQLFYERGLQLLKSDGYLCFITSNKWMRTRYGEKLRDLFSKKTQPLKLIDLSGYKVFESATVDNNILLTSHGDWQNSMQATAIGRDFKKGDDMAKYAIKNSIKIPRQSNDVWFIGTPAEVSLKEKIERVGVPLKEWDISIYRGILTGLTKAFIINKETRDELIKKDPVSAEILKPLITGKDIERYQAKWEDKWWLIDAHNGYDDVSPVDIHKYIAIKHHLDKHYAGLKSRKDQGITPYNLRHCAYYREFMRNKIVWTAVNSEYRAAMIPPNVYINNSLFMITGDCLEIICAFLNCKLCRKYLEYNLSHEKIYNYGSKDILSSIPIPRFSPNENSKVIDIFRKIVSCKSNDSNYKNLLEEFDNLIYNFYNLNREEIIIVEKL